MSAALENSIDSLPDLPRHRWLEIALVFLVFFAIGGTPAPQVNEPHYLTKAKHYWNPDWCSGDLFLESADAHLTFYWTVGWLTKWFSLPAVSWIGRMVAWATLAWAWQRLSSRVVPLRFGAVITALLWVTLTARCNLAGEWVIGGVEGKCFAYSLILWALAEMVVDNWQRVWPLLGVASAFHVIVGGWSVICAALTWMWEPRRSRPTFFTLLPSLLLGGLFALPGVVPALLLTANVPAEVSTEANQIYVFERLPHHLALHKLPADEIFVRVRRFGLLIVGFVGLTIWQLSKDGPSNIGLTRIQRYAWASVAICMVGLAWEFATINNPALSAKVLKYYWYRTSDIAVPMAVALSLGSLIISLKERQGRLTLVVAIVAVTMPGIMLVKDSCALWANAHATETYEARHTQGWHAACEWIREHTDPKALFIIPRRGFDFRWYAERPAFFAWKDVPQDARSLVVWWQRFQEAYYGAIDESGETRALYSLQELGADRIRELATKHKIDYLVTTEYPPLPLPVAYENPWYKVYDLRIRVKAE